MAAIAWDRVEERQERVTRPAPLELVAGPPSRRRPSAAAYRQRRLAVQAEPQATVEHVVVGHQAGGYLPGQRAVLGADLGADAPGFGELGLQEGPRAQAHGFEQLGQRIHRGLTFIVSRRLDQECRRPGYRRPPASFLT